MAKNYAPKVGDLVMAQGQNVVFQVLAVEANEIKLQPFHVGKQEMFGKVVTHIPRSALSQFKEVASRARCSDREAGN